jgi:hypothetical protein
MVTGTSLGLLVAGGELPLSWIVMVVVYVPGASGEVAPESEYGRTAIGRVETMPVLVPCAAPSHITANDGMSK